MAYNKQVKFTPAAKSAASVGTAIPQSSMAAPYLNRYIFFKQ